MPDPIILGSMTQDLPANKPLDKVSCRMILYFPISDTIYEAILLQASYSPAHS